MSSRTLAKSVGVGRFVTGTYTGNGAATQAIVGVGFQPRFVLIYTQFQALRRAMKTDRDGLNTAMTEWAVVSGSVEYHYETDQIISLDADGFTVGDGTGDANVWNLLNENGAVYTYVAFG